MTPADVRVVAVRENVATLVRPGARYAVLRHDDGKFGGYTGRWVPETRGRPPGFDDAFSFDEARLLLPLLRSLHARGGGRPAAKPTTTHGRLVARAQRRTGLTLTLLGARIGAHPSKLSRVLAGKKHLTAEQHEKLVALVKGAQAS